MPTLSEIRQDAEAEVARLRAELRHAEAVLKALGGTQKARQGKPPTGPVQRRRRRQAR